MKAIKIHICVIFVFVLSLNILAQETIMPDPSQIGIDEKLSNTIPLELHFIDDKGDTVLLADLITKPTVLTMVYYRCPNLCSAVLSGQADVMNRSDLVPGIDYNAITVSINHEETWDLGRDKRNNYLNLIDRKIEPESWKFMVGDSLSIVALSNAVGFKFLKVNEEFAHTGALIILSPDGKVIRYLYGTEFLKFDFKMAITEALAGRSGPSITKVLAYCFTYDPNGRTYTFNVVRVMGTVILIFLALFILFLIIKRVRN